MQPHFKYTYRQIISEASMLIQPYVNIFNYDTDTIARQLNLAMRSMVYSLIPLKLWAFKNQTTVTHKTPIPLDFVEDISLIITISGGNIINTEARKVNFREYYQLWNWENCHRWNFARQTQPIYTFAGENVVGQRRMVIYIAPNIDFFTGSPPGFSVTNEIPTNNLQGILEYYAVPSKVFNLDSNLPFPDEYAELLVLDLSIRFLSLTADPYRLINLHKEILEKRKSLWNIYATQIIQERKEMDVFVEPTPPISDLPPVKGEVESKLI